MSCLVAVLHTGLRAGGARTGRTGNTCAGVR
eukprot:COSAG02_NODE_20707_length_818_cov_1.148818_1_plen_30_part_10